MALQGISAAIEDLCDHAVNQVIDLLLLLLVLCQPIALAGEISG